MAVTALAPPCSADPVDEAGLTPRANARAGAQAAAADDFSAAYYNPARLSGQRASFTIGYVVAQPLVSVERTTVGRFGLYTSPSEYDGTVAGMVIPLDGRLHRRVALGLALYLPRASESHFQLTDQRRPQWLQYGADPRRLVLVPAVGVRVWRGLSLGIGIDVLSKLVGVAQVTLDPTTKQISSRTYTDDLDATASPIVGAAFSAGRLRLGAFYRHTTELPFHLPIDVHLKSLGDLTVDARGVGNYSPPRFGFGATYDLGWRGITADAEVEYELWHLAPPPQYDVNVDAGGTIGSVLGSSSTTDIRPGFRDTWVARLAAELPVGRRGRVIAGVRYRPTALLPQSGPTNYLESDKLALSVGGGTTVEDPLRLAMGGIRLEAALTGARLFWQSSVKNNKTYASYRYGGWQWSGIVSATMLFSGANKRR